MTRTGDPPVCRRAGRMSCKQGSAATVQAAKHSRSASGPLLLRPLQQLVVAGKGGSWARSHCSTPRLPPSAAKAQVWALHGPVGAQPRQHWQPAAAHCRSARVPAPGAGGCWARSQASTSVWPPLAAQASQGQAGRWERSHCSTPRWPAAATSAQDQGSRGQQGCVKAQPPAAGAAMLQVRRHSSAPLRPAALPLGPPGGS